MTEGGFRVEPRRGPPSPPLGWFGQRRCVRAGGHFRVQAFYNFGCGEGLSYVCERCGVLLGDIPLREFDAPPSPPMGGLPKATS